MEKKQAFLLKKGRILEKVFTRLHYPGPNSSKVPPVSLFHWALTPCFHHHFEMKAAQNDIIWPSIYTKMFLQLASNETNFEIGVI